VAGPVALGVGPTASVGVASVDSSATERPAGGTSWST